MTVIYVLLIFIFVTSVFLAIYGSRDNSSYDEDAVIVLGYGIKNQKMPQMLKKRLDKTVEYHAKNPDAIIVVSGGRGNEIKASEAAVMEEYLLSNGIPSNLIMKEDKSRTTVENFKLSGELLKEKFGADYSAVIITNVFHIYRSEKYAKAAGMSIKHIGAETVRHDIPWIYIREVAMLVQMIFIKGRKFR
ncbi:MAG: YdcF family protein [Clostridia bacterium]|nr:YdcF family protein [Clostridia bacterium]MBQ4603171.1 YdcF family protein [Clostridia bacterium]